MAREQNEARQAEYRAWILTHTPQEIHAANLARTQLRRILKGRQKSGPAHTGILHDDRQVKRASNPYAFFFGERIHSGDFKNIKVGESAKLVAAEWRALSAGEKKVCAACSLTGDTTLAYITTEIRRRDGGGQGAVHARDGRSVGLCLILSSAGFRHLPRYAYVHERRI
jgi:hypothetical protein